ncbi:MAG: outer membrane protein assembly factor BamA [Planctomycetota bacterium]
MNHDRSHGALALTLLLTLALALILALTATAAAQPAPADPGDPGDPAAGRDAAAAAMHDEVVGLTRLEAFANRRISDVRIEALRYNGTFDPVQDISGYANFIQGNSWLRKHILTNSGQLLRIASIRDDINRLERTGFFNLIQVMASGSADDSSPITLIYRLRSRPVEQIVFSPEKLLTESVASLKSRMAIKEGQEYKQTACDHDVRLLTRENKKNISHVAIRVELMQDPATGEFADGLRVTVFLVENRYIDEVIFRGHDGGKGTDDLRKLLETTRSSGGGYLNPDLVERDAQRIVEEYKSEGWYFCEVHWHLERQEQPGQARPRDVLVFDIVEGPKVKVRNLYFPGLELLSPDKGDVLFDMPNEWWDLWYSIAIWLSNDQARQRPFRHELKGDEDYKPRELERDILRMAEVLRGNGWLDAKVYLEDESFTTDRQAVDLTWRFVPGVLYKVRSITLRGKSDAFTPDDLRNRMQVKEGGTFRQMAVFGSSSAQDPVKRLGDHGLILRMYQDKGYFNSKVEVKYTTVAPNIVDIVYDIQQGVRVKIGEVLIHGNDATRSTVIRNLMATRPGQWYSASAVEYDTLRLLRTRWFAQPPKIGVRITPVPADPPYDPEQYVDVHVNVEEGETGSFNLGVGWSSEKGIVGFFNLTKSNFDIAGFPHFTGGGQTLELSAQPGPLSQTYKLSFDEPYFFRSRFSFRTSFAYVNESLPDFDTLDWVYTAAFGYALLPDLRVQLEYKWNWSKALNVSGSASAAIQEAKISKVYSSLRFSVDFDRRDDPFFPTRGFNIQSGYELGGEYLGGNVDWWHWDVKGSLNFPFPIPLLTTALNQEPALNIRLAFDWQEPWNGATTIPILRRVALGGAAGPNTPAMRGFEREGVGPRDSSGSSLRGSARLAANVELRYPLQPGIIYLVLFFDIGQLAPTIDDIALNKFNMSWGFGLRLKLPISPAPLALDFGFPIQSFPGDRLQTVSFSLGFNF